MDRVFQAVAIMRRMIVFQLNEPDHACSTFPRKYGHRLGLLLRRTIAVMLPDCCLRRQVFRPDVL